jgi:hypothetical protein
VTVINVPRKFLVRQLCREYGIEAFRKLSKLAAREPSLTWIIVTESADRVSSQGSIRKRDGALEIIGLLEAVSTS